MRVQLKLVEASPKTLVTTGEVKNVSAFGSPTIADAAAALYGGSRFATITGVHSYQFHIAGEGTIKLQAFDAERGVALAPPQTFATSAEQRGYSYEFGVP